MLGIFGVGTTVWAAATIQTTLHRSASLDSGLIAHYTFDGTDTDIATASGGSWTEVTSSADFSVRTRAQTLLSYDDKLWLIGGWNGAQIEEVWNSSDGANWSLVTNSLPFGANATKEALVYDGKMWLLGGGDNSVWNSTNGSTWTQVTSDAGWGGSGTRNQHAVLVYDNKMWMLGGWSGTNRHDVWYSTDGVNWTEATSAAGWSIRQNHSAVAYDGKMWVIGGGDAEVWYSTDGANWTQATSDAGVGGSLISHRSLVYDNKMWIITGQIEGYPSSKVWSSEDGVTWTQVASAPGFTSRLEAGAVVHDGKIWLVAGRNGGTNFLNDVWSTTIPGTNQVTDSSGNGNNGTHEGNTRETTLGRIGQALKFDGTSDYVLVGDTSASARTISFWIKPEAAGSVMRLSSTASIGVAGGPVQFIGASTGVNSSTLPPHKAGDLLVAFAYRDGSTTAPSLVSGWTNVNASGASTNSSRLAYRVASASGTSSGTWTNATSAVFHVYRGVNQSTPIGGNGSGSGASTTVTYPSLTMSVSDGSSWVTGFAGHRSTNTGLENPPPGMVNRASVVDGTDEASGHDTAGGVSSWSAQSVSVGGTSRGWRAQTLEIRSADSTITTTGISSPTIYIDGVSGSTLEAGKLQHVVITSSTPISVSDLQIGRNGSSYFKGVLDDVRLYNKVLTADEINRVYHVGATTKINTTLKRSDIDNGLVLHYTFDGQTATGGTVTDQSGNGRNGTYSTTEVSLGRIGQGMYFNGTGGSNKVQVADHSSLNPGMNSFTYGLWVKAKRSVSDWDMPFYKGGASAGDFGYDIELGNDVWGAGISDGSTNYIAFFNDNGWSGPYLKNGQWYHLMAVIDRSNNQLRTYRDGSLVDTTSISGAGSIQTTKSLEFGGRTDIDGPLPYDGVIDDVRIYNKALTATEINRIYHLGATTHVNTTLPSTDLDNGLVGHWTFDGGTISGSTISDVAGSNNGTYTNGIGVGPGKIGQGLLFGSSTYVSVPYNSSFNLTSDMSVATWVKLDSSPTGPVSFVTRAGSSPAQFFLGIKEVGVDKLPYFDAGTQATSTAALSEDRWQLLVGVFNNTANTVSLYVDGQLDNSVTYTGTPASNTVSPVYIGSKDGTGEWVPGTMDDVRIYNRALSADEVKRLYELGH